MKAKVKKGAERSIDVSIHEYAIGKNPSYFSSLWIGARSILTLPLFTLKVFMLLLIAVVVAAFAITTKVFVSVVMIPIAAVLGYATYPKSEECNCESDC